MTGLAAAFGLGPREVVALVGGGGKTTAMFRLARELGPGAVITTTTKIFVPPIEADLAPVTTSDRAALVDETRHAGRAGRIPVVGTTVTDTQKLVGVAPEVIDELAALDEVRYVLVEADGARQHPFKAPREGEPVIPASCTVVIGVVGIDVLGGRLSDVAHRPERVAALLDRPLDAILDVDAVASVIVHPRGTAKDVPPSARYVVLINKADGDASLEAARGLAQELMTRGILRVVITSLASPEPVRAVLTA